jgi:hypothetical protein
MHTLIVKPRPKHSVKMYLHFKATWIPGMKARVLEGNYKLALRLQK